MKPMLFALALPPIAGQAQAGQAALPVWLARAAPAAVDGVTDASADASADARSDSQQSTPRGAAPDSGRAR